MNRRFLSALAIAALASPLAGCGDDGPPDYLAIAGGGITFNYRYSQATMVVVGKQLTPMPEGARVEALFDIPGAKDREVVSRPVMKGKLTYKLESSYLTGIRKGEPLKVTLRLVAADGQELDRVETQYTSDVDQSTLPSKPLVDPSKPNYVPQLENL
ncbi:MAG: hypothetical protein LCH46_01840 [Proteobacteria bacterium]|nr:hypothetical protein [Pseudomonadota bacterium]